MWRIFYNHRKFFIALILLATLLAILTGKYWKNETNFIREIDHEILKLQADLGKYTHSESSHQAQKQKTPENCHLKYCPTYNPDKINLHLVAHTHTDPGWLKTVDKYFTDQVYYILNTVILELVENPERKFIFVEISFFERWYRRQNQDKKDTVKKLVRNGRLTFTEGFWTMPDEAVTHYSDVITNAELGSQFLFEEFGDACFNSKTAWQIDPFGHSRGLMELFKMMEFENFFFGRLDYNEKQKKRKSSHLEWFWESSKISNKHNSKPMFTSTLANLYTNPTGFCWSTDCNNMRSGNSFIVDDPELEGYNIQNKVEQLMDHVNKFRKPGYQHNNFLIPMGGDFHFTSANYHFDNLDKLIKYTREKYGDILEINYSTPECYAQAVQQSLEAKNLQLPIEPQSGDFFPYSDSYIPGYEHKCHWTGYYSSRPNLKIESRNKSSILNTCYQFELTNLVENNSCEKLKKAVSLLQHHDAITGTEEPHVVRDYSKRLETASQYFYEKIAANSSFNFPTTTSKPGKNHQPPVAKPSNLIIYNSQNFPINQKYKNLNLNLPPNGFIEINLNDRSEQEVLKRAFLDKPKKSLTKSISDQQILKNQFYETTLKKDALDESLTLEIIENSSNLYHEIKIYWQYYVSSTGAFGDGVTSGAYVFKPDRNLPPVTIGEISGIKFIDVDRVEILVSVDFLTYNLEIDLPQENIKQPSIIINYSIGPIPTTGKIKKSEPGDAEQEAKENATDQYGLLKNPFSHYHSQEGREIILTLENRKYLLPNGQVKQISNR